MKKPIYAMAPMAGITDSPFRRMCKKYGADVVYSEMASATALNYNPRPTLELLRFEEVERPYVVQLFGADPEHFARAVKIVEKEIKPDGIDINFGCPVKKVQKQGAGAVLMGDLKKSRSIIEACLANTDLPVSVKTRAKVGGVGVLKFLDNIRDLNVAALMIHGRTIVQMFSGEIDADIIKRARDYFGGIILANGFYTEEMNRETERKVVYNYYQKLLRDTGADGLGIARAALGRPWIFKSVRAGQSVIRSPRAVFKEALEHAELMLEYKGEQGIVEMHKHLCWYAQGLPGAVALRRELIRVKAIDDIRKIFTEYKSPPSGVI